MDKTFKIVWFRRSDFAASEGVYLPDTKRSSQTAKIQKMSKVMIRFSPAARTPRPPAPAPQTPRPSWGGSAPTDHPDLEPPAPIGDPRMGGRRPMAAAPPHPLPHFVGISRVGSAVLEPSLSASRRTSPQPHPPVTYNFSRTAEVKFSRNGESNFTEFWEPNLPEFQIQIFPAKRKIFLKRSFWGWYAGPARLAPARPRPGFYKCMFLVCPPSRK